MINADILSTIRPRDGQKLSKTVFSPEENTNSTTTVLQMLFRELASLRQQVNSLALSQAGPRQPKHEYYSDNEPVVERRVEPKKMRRVFD